MSLKWQGSLIYLEKASLAILVLDFFPSRKFMPKPCIL